VFLALHFTQYPSTAMFTSILSPWGIRPSCRFGNGRFHRPTAARNYTRQERPRKDKRRTTEN
ncbi:MAG: hypothetical protein IJ131_07380, partial [Eggerthellaceae bacterium]|nr:hypothetical protein [Eggerthellaceae bacterium]